MHDSRDAPGDQRQTDRLFTLKEAGEELAASRVSVLAWLKTGQLKGEKAGRLWRIRQSAIDEFLKEPAPAPEAPKPPARGGAIDWQRYDALKARKLSRRMIARELGIPETTLRRLEKRRGGD